MKLRLSLGAAIAALALASCGGSVSAETTFDEVPTAITVTSGFGNVSVQADDGPTTVIAEITASGETPEWSATMNGTELVIDDACGDRTDCTVNLIVRAAATADVTITSSDGGISIAGFNSSVSLSGGADNVVLNGIVGPISVDLTKGSLLAAGLVTDAGVFHTGAGNLDVTIVEPFTSLSVTSDVGDVTAQVPGGEYDVTATTPSGSIEIDVDDVDGAASSIVITSQTGDVKLYRR